MILQAVMSESMATAETLCDFGSLLRLFVFLWGVWYWFNAKFGRVRVALNLIF